MATKNGNSFPAKAAQRCNEGESALPCESESKLTQADPGEFVSLADDVQEITYRMCDHDFDIDLVESRFDDAFIHHANGAKSDKAGYIARGREYRAQFESIERPVFYELVELDGGRVLVAYTLTLHRTDGDTQRMAVMAVWTLTNGKVTALREIDAPAA